MEIQNLQKIKMYEIYMIIFNNISNLKEPLRKHYS